MAAGRRRRDREGLTTATACWPTGTWENPAGKAVRPRLGPQAAPGVERNGPSANRAMVFLRRVYNYTRKRRLDRSCPTSTRLTPSTSSPQQRRDGHGRV